MSLKLAIVACSNEWSKIQNVNDGTVQWSVIGSSWWVTTSTNFAKNNEDNGLGNAREICKSFQK